MVSDTGHEDVKQQDSQETTDANGTQEANASGPSDGASKDGGGAAKPQGNSTKIVMGAIVVAALVALFWPSDGGKRGYLDGKLYDSGDHEIFLSTQYSKVSLIHFWSTWCLPCLDELPQVQRVKDDYAANQDFTVIMIAVADDEKKVADFLGPRLSDTLFDPDWRVTKRFDTHKLPETHLVVDGQIIDRFVGVTDWDSAPIRQRIDTAIANAGL